MPSFGGHADYDCLIPHFLFLSLSLSLPLSLDVEKYFLHYWVDGTLPKCPNLSQNRAGRARPLGGNVEQPWGPRFASPMPSPLFCLRPAATASRYLPRGPLATDVTHLMRFFDRMRGAFTAAPTRLLPVNHIPHAAPTTLSPKPKAMPKLA